jgi:glycosylphosphatidylinositol transamidase
MMKMMWSHASGIPTGNHGLFHRYHIEAVTIEGITKKFVQGNIKHFYYKFSPFTVPLIA